MKHAFCQFRIGSIIVISTEKYLSFYLFDSIPCIKFYQTLFTQLRNYLQSKLYAFTEWPKFLITVCQFSHIFFRGEKISFFVVKSIHLGISSP